MNKWLGMTTVMVAGALAMSACGKKEAAPATPEETTSMIEKARRCRRQGRRSRQRSS